MDPAETPANTGTDADDIRAGNPRHMTVKKILHSLQQERYDHKNLPVVVDSPVGRLEIVGVAIDKESGHVVFDAEQPVNSKAAAKKGAKRNVQR